MSFHLPTLRNLAPLLAIVILATTQAVAAENACGPMTPAEEQVLKLTQENDLLSSKLKELQSLKSIPVDRLRHIKAMRLKEIAVAAKNQRQSTADFEGFVKWMSTNLAGYNKYIQAGSYAAVIARVLPIPYAGQASVFTKFVAQFTLALNAASVSINNYLNSSQKFISMTEPIDTTKPLDDKILSDTATFADQKMLKDMSDAQQKLAAVSDLSAGALSFLESLNHYVSGTDEYWNKAKGVFKKDMDPKEKSFVSESTSNLKIQADRFNGKLRTFEELGRKQITAVKALAVYDELAAEALVPK
jgi:hypothetical protein